MTLKEKVEAYIGTFSTDLSEWLTQGARIVFNLLPLDKKIRFATKITGENSVAIYNKDIINVSVEGEPATIVESNMKDNLSDTHSIYEAITITPVYYIEDGNVIGKPNGTVTVNCYTLPEANQSSINIINFPEEFEILPILYSAIQAKLKTIMASIASNYTITMPTSPTAISTPTFTYISAVLGPYVPVTIDSVVPPVFNKPTLTMSYTNLTTALTEEDSEKVQSEASKLSIQLKEYETNIQNELSKFNEQVKYQEAELSKTIQQAQLNQQRLIDLAKSTTDLSVANEAKKLEKQVIEYQSLLSKYQNDIGKYQADIQSAIQKTQLIQSIITQDLNAITVLKNEYTSNLQLLIGVNNGK